MDIEDFAFGFFLTFGAILIFSLVVLFRDNNINGYQKCICEKVEE